MPSGVREAGRIASARALMDEPLRGEIRRSFQESDESYGVGLVDACVATYMSPIECESTTPERLIREAIFN